MHSQETLLALYIEAATKAIKEIGGTKEFKKLPLFGSNSNNIRAHQP